jgi:general secretion pathway protein G
MERSIVTGNRISDFRFRNADLKVKPFNPRSTFSNLQSKGFTLLELMIVITIIIILAAIVLPQYQKTITAAREAVLRDDLYKIRALLDQYGADKGKLPQSLDDLVSSGYMREKPVDPFTDQADWATETGDDPNSNSGEQGIVNVRSASTEVGSDGRPYSEW